ncbi:hypothetical protein NDU88_005355 [Pleurodeles waltl]|uniref:Uncharacterized protein n=1 Tax=Pleurodeles waltl TaxID=8319 RepID=A0AAV7MW17_PLEWA|nr:hypothetical protein NDU88_005355 [Pleurodeles waltl]
MGSQAFSLTPPVPFLPKAGEPAIKWCEWKDYFLNYVAAFKEESEDAFSSARKKCILLHCLGPEGQRVYTQMEKKQRASKDSDVFKNALENLATHYQPVMAELSKRCAKAALSNGREGEIVCKVMHDGKKVTSKKQTGRAVDIKMSQQGKVIVCYRNKVEDYLSHSPLPFQESDEGEWNEYSLAFTDVVDDDLGNVECSVVNEMEWDSSYKSDCTLQEIMGYVHSGWPCKSKLNQNYVK